MTHVRLLSKSPAFTLDVDFAVPPGTTAIFGGPLAGKSLLLELIAGLARAAAGRILFNDAILFDAAARVEVPARARGFGYLATGESLFPHMTLRQNLRFAAQRFPRLERHRRVAEWLEKFQLAAAESLYPQQLSPAQRLSGAVARMLIGEPRLVLLDHEGVSEALLLRIGELTQAPILFATRDVDLCCAAASHMLVLDSGRIVQAGAPREVVDRPASAEAARLLGIANVYEGRIGVLDPGRNSSTIEFDGFALTAPYLPGHFRGDRIWVAIRPGDLRVRGEASGSNCIALPLVRASFRTNMVRLEFAHGVFADLPLEAYESQKDNKDWYVEFPAGALQIL